MIGVDLLQIREGPKSLGSKRLGGLATDAPHPLDRECRKSFSEPFGADADQSIGLLEIRCDLRHELVRCDAHRNDEPQLLERPSPDFGGDGDSIAQQSLRTGHIHEGLIETERLDQGTRLLENRHESPAEFRVAGAPTGDHHGMRTESQSGAGGHGAAAPEFPCLVACRGDDSSGADSADEHRSSAQGGIIELLHRREECIEIAVKNGAR